MAPPEPTLSRPDSASVQVDVTERVFSVLQASLQQGTPLGSAFPGPQWFALPKLAQALAASARQATAQRTALDDLTPGHSGLRRQIARRYLADGMPLAMDDLVITNGALEALNLCLAAVTRPGGAVVVESPCFYGALQALERLGLQAIEVPTHPRDGVDLQALEAALLQHRPQAVWLMTSFQNPLGSLMPPARKQALVELVTRLQVPLIEDDVYGELYFAPHRPLPAKAFDREGWVLHCSSFSKCLAPGWRIGWTAAGRFTQAVARQKLTTSIATNGPAQAALAQYLEGRLRQAPAPPAPRAGGAARPHGRGHCATFLRHARHAARRRLLSVAGTAHRLRRLGPVPARAAARHQPGARPAVQPQPGVCPLPAAELRHCLGCRHRGGSGPAGPLVL
jgi:DNA-binding transcriptional MocR family regulator